MKREYVITRPRHVRAGIFSYMWESLRSLYPYHEDIDSYKYYFDWNFYPKNFRVDSTLNHITKNVWEYYFEQPSELSDDIIEYRKQYNEYDFNDYPSLTGYPLDITDEFRHGEYSLFGIGSFYKYFHSEQHPHIEYDGISTHIHQNEEREVRVEHPIENPQGLLKWRSLNVNATLPSNYRQGFNEGAIYTDNKNYKSNTFIYNKIIKHLVVPKSHVQNKIDTITEQFSNHNVLGVHVRETDLSIWFDMLFIDKPMVDSIIDKVDEKLANNKFDRIFLMSDSEEVVNKFKNKYGNQLITHNSIRSHNKLPVHLDNEDNIAYKISEDVIVEAYALSKTNFLVLSNPSNVNYFVRCLAPNLDFYCTSELYFESLKHTPPHQAQTQQINNQFVLDNWAKHHNNPTMAKHRPVFPTGVESGYANTINRQQLEEMIKQSFKYNNEQPLLNDNVLHSEMKTRKGSCPCENCTENNSFRDDVFVIIQGHTNELLNIVRSYHGYKNIIWVLDSTCPLEHYNFLKDQTYINTCIANTGDFAGFGNVNWQARSTVAGIQYAKELGAKYCIKIRSDMALFPLEKFINNMNFDKVGFLWYCLNGYFNYDRAEYDVNIFRDTFIEYYKLKDNNNITRNYVTDFCVSGPVDEVIAYFNWQEKETIPTVVEMKLLWNYMLKKGYYMDTSREFLQEKFYFFADLLRDYEIDLISFKHNHENWTNHRERRGWLYA